MRRRADGEPTVPNQLGALTICAACIGWLVAFASLPLLGISLGVAFVAMTIDDGRAAAWALAICVGISGGFAFACGVLAVGIVIDGAQAFWASRRMSD